LENNDAQSKEKLIDTTNIFLIIELHKILDFKQIHEYFYSAY